MAIYTGFYCIFIREKNNIAGIFTPFNRPGVLEALTDTACRETQGS